MMYVSPVQDHLSRLPLPKLRPPFSIRKVVTAPSDDAELIHDWMHEEHVRKFWNRAWPLPVWREQLEQQLAGSDSLPCLAAFNGKVLAYIEVYQVARHPVSRAYPCGDHDLGIHVAIGDRANTGAGLGRLLLQATGEGLLAAAPECMNVVAEPDVRNMAARKAFAAAGFCSRGEAELPDKTAALMIYKRSGRVAVTQVAAQTNVV